jgi:hypothetical protein
MNPALNKHLVAFQIQTAVLAIHIKRQTRMSRERSFMGSLESGGHPIVYMRRKTEMTLVGCKWQWCVQLYPRATRSSSKNGVEKSRAHVQNTIDHHTVTFEQLSTCVRPLQLLVSQVVMTKLPSTRANQKASGDIDGRTLRVEIKTVIWSSTNDSRREQQ